MTDLNSLARTLAERLTTKLDEMVEFETFKNGRTAGFLRRGASEQTEAVIREAIDKTLEEAEQSITRMLTDPRPYPFSQHVELAIKACASEVKLLKQSNSGIEAKKL